MRCALHHTLLRSMQRDDQQSCHRGLVSYIRRCCIDLFLKGLIFSWKVLQERVLLSHKFTGQIRIHLRIILHIL